MLFYLNKIHNIILIKRYAAVVSVIGITGISTWMLQDKTFAFERRSLPDDIPHIVNVETGYIHADEHAGEHLNKLKNEKAYVKYYYPTEKFVPLDELPIVCNFKWNEVLSSRKRYL